MGLNFILLCVLGFIIGIKGDQCITPNDEDGQCVYIEACKSLMDIFEKPLVTDLDKYTINAHTKACQHTKKQNNVCCPISEIMPPETTTTKVYVPPIQESCALGRCVNIYNCSVLLNIALNPYITAEDKKYLQGRRCKSNTDVLSVCCPESEQPEVPKITNTAPQECETPKGVPGICMASEDCIPISIIYRKNKQTQKDMQFLADSVCPTQDELYCCPTVVYPETVAPTTTTTAAPIVETCETPNGAKGTCISVIHCEPLMRILQKAEFFDNDAQYLNASFCGDAANFPKVCCPETPAAEEFSLPQPPYCGAVSAANAEFDSGVITNEEEYPWTALLLYKNKMGKTHIYCGGTLIHERFVLTAAHCLDEQESQLNLTGVRLGVWAIKVMQYCQNQEPNDQLDCESKHIDMVVSKVIKHPEHESMYNDLALLQLNAAVRVTRYVTPICLPFDARQLSAGFDDDDNAAMQISGWGTRLYGEMAEFKMKSITYLSNMEDCRNLYSNAGAGNLTAKHVCVKGKGTDDGNILDSGGALMTLVNVGKMQSYFLVGIEAISYEIPPEEGYPFIFTRVSAYLDWIKSEISGI